MDMVVVGGRCAAARNALGLSLEELAGAAGVMLDYLQEVENGSAEPCWALLELLAERGVNLNYLVTGTGGILVVAGEGDTAAGEAASVPAVLPAPGGAALGALNQTLAVVRGLGQGKLPEQLSGVQGQAVESLRKFGGLGAKHLKAIQSRGRLAAASKGEDGGGGKGA